MHVEQSGTESLAYSWPQRGHGGGCGGSDSRGAAAPHFPLKKGVACPSLKKSRFFFVFWTYAIFFIYFLVRNRRQPASNRVRNQRQIEFETTIKSSSKPTSNPVRNQRQTEFETGVPPFIFSEFWRSLPPLRRGPRAEPPKAEPPRPPPRRRRRPQKLFNTKCRKVFSS